MITRNNFSCNQQYMKYSQQTLYISPTHALVLFCIIVQNLFYLKLALIK